MESENVKWLQLVQNRGKWQVFVNVEMNFHAPQKQEIFSLVK
jgi:hypothetical protein